MSKDKIYFAGSIRGGREDVDLYHELIRNLQNYGEVLTEHIGNREISIQGEDGISDSFIHNRDLGWLTKANRIVAEVTTASLGVGYELGRIVERNLWIPSNDKKLILCLYRPNVNKRLSAMIKCSEGILSEEYKTLNDAKNIIDEFMKNGKRD
ncbi:nucleoside 2-deoxyribosyltransferase [Candidatus Pacearchaeota archaeon CG10_big_fil_rev_8_21_14_0_10_32_14]|nr:MAG: nucleoside 2-deoxyribosyltransferase [Candidatus Pacearchaeota archaeon CG10_big_fil_rev_8_21_14_0_10_32_14]